MQGSPWLVAAHVHEHVSDASRHLVRRCTDVGDPGRKAGHGVLFGHARRVLNALKDYGVENAGDLMSLLVRLEDSFGIVPAADGAGLSLDPKAPHAPKAATAVKLWAEKRAQLENGEIGAREYEDWKASL